MFFCTNIIHPSPSPRVIHLSPPFARFHSIHCLLQTVNSVLKVEAATRQKRQKRHEPTLYSPFSVCPCNLPAAEPPAQQYGPTRQENLFIIDLWVIPDSQNEQQDHFPDASPRVVNIPPQEPQRFKWSAHSQAARPAQTTTEAMLRHNWGLPRQSHDT